MTIQTDNYCFLFFFGCTSTLSYIKKQILNKNNNITNGKTVDLQLKLLGWVYWCCSTKWSFTFANLNWPLPVQTDNCQLTLTIASLKLQLSVLFRLNCQLNLTSVSSIQTDDCELKFSIGCLNWKLTSQIDNNFFLFWRLLNAFIYFQIIKKILIRSNISV